MIAVEKLTKKRIIFKSLFIPLFTLLGMVLSSFSLAVPDLSNESIIGYAAGMRPFRKEGIRLEAEYYKDKVIIHDYGHGGGGITLSWGCAKASVEIFENILKEHPEFASDEIAIIGSGVIGLTTAHVLLDLGYKVHIYASEFPPNTTSDVAAGLWSAVAVTPGSSDESQQSFEKMQRQSFADFKALAESTNPRFKGVSYLDIFTFKQITNMKNLPLGLIASGVPFTTSFGEEDKNGMYFRGLLADCSIYIPELYNSAKERGARFTQVYFKSQEDLDSIPSPVIFNCSGLGSRLLFNDTSVVGLRGQLIYLKPHQEISYMLTAPKPREDLDVYMIPLKDKIALGGSYELEGKDTFYDPEVCEQILKHTREFFNQSQAEN